MLPLALLCTCTLRECDYCGYARLEVAAASIRGLFDVRLLFEEIRYVHGHSAWLGISCKTLLLCICTENIHVQCACKYTYL